MIDYDKINLNEYALKLRRDGKTFKQIGDEFGVSRERARQRVAWASRHEKKLERHEAATTMCDLFMSARAMNTINTMSALDMTFDEFLDNDEYRDAEGNTSKSGIRGRMERLSNALKGIAQ